MDVVEDQGLIDKLNAKRQGAPKATGVVDDPDFAARLTAKAELQRGTKADKPTPVVPEGEGSIVDRLMGDIAGRRQEVSDTLSDWLNPEQGQMVAEMTGQEAPRELGAPEALLQMGGKGIAGTYFDVAGAGLSALFEGASSGIAMVVPDEWEDSIKQGAVEGMDWVLSSPQAEVALAAIQDGREAYDAWKSANPQDAKTLESVVNIAAAFVPGPKAAPVKPKGPSVLERVASHIEGKQSDKIARELLDTSHIKKGAKDRVQNTTVVRGKKITSMTPDEQAMAKELRSLKLDRPSMSGAFYQKNYIKINQANKAEAKKLEAMLGSSSKTVDDVGLKQQIRLDGGRMIADDPVLQTKEALARQFERVQDKALDLFSRQDQTPLGLLKARRDFDDWVTSVKSERAAYGEGLETAFKQSVRSVRKSMNQLVADTHGGKAVRNSLNRQHQFYKALDIIEGKADDEAKTILGRLYQNVHKTTQVHLPTTPLAAAATVGGLGTLVSGYAPLIGATLALGGGAALTYKAARSPATYRAIDKAIKTSTNPEMIKQLRLDRAALIEIAQSGDPEE